MQTQALKTLNTFYKIKRTIFLSIAQNNNVLAR